MKKLRLILILLIVAATLLNTGCGIDILEPAVDTDKGGVEYLIVENGEVSLPLTGFNDLNPLIVDNVDYYYFSKLIFEGLFDYDSSIEPIPQLASTYTMSEDGKRLEIILREDVLWHNGDPFNANDVIFTFNTLVNARNSGYLYKLIENTVRGPVDLGFIKIRKLSDRSVEVLFKEPISNYKDLLTFPIIPASTGSSTSAGDGFIPIGTGPFKFQEYVKYKEVKLISNPDYRGGEPSISRVTGKIFEDEELILTAFETGKLSMARSIDTDWDKYEHIKHITFYEYVSDESEVMIFNHKRDSFWLESGRFLEKAIMFGIDRQDIIGKVLLEHGTQTDSPVHPQSYLFSQSSSYYGFSRESALSQLAESGLYQFDSATGKVVNVDSKEELVLELLVNPNNKKRLKVAESIKADLIDLGIRIDIIQMELLKDETTEQAFKRYLDSGSFDIALAKYSISAIPEYARLLNEIGYDNSSDQVEQIGEMENILNEMYRTWDEDRKAANYKLFQDIFVDSLPYGSLYFENKALLVNSDIMGPLNPSFYNLYEGLEECYLTFSTD